MSVCSDIISASSASMSRAYSATRAESLIQEVQDLYRFGVSVGILQADGRLADGLEVMKTTFRAVSSTGGNEAASSR